MGDASNILGWMSIACWIVVYTPQFVENYLLQSGEGLSVLFVLIWLLGDLTNLAGAALAGLLPTVIIVAVYYTLCDITLLVQIYYYRWKGSARLSLSGDEPTESTSLLAGTGEDALVKASTESNRETIRHTISVAFVIGAGVAAWLFGSGTANTPASDGDTLSQIFGWSSAALYLSSRVPQIIKNMETKCEGLSPVFFAFAMCGNITYILSICAASMEWKYLLINSSWLIGNVGTIFMDLFVLYQFLHFRAQREQSQSLSVDAAAC